MEPTIEYNANTESNIEELFVPEMNTKNNDELIPKEELEAFKKEVQKNVETLENAISQFVAVNGDLNKKLKDTQGKLNVMIDDKLKDFRLNAYVLDENNQEKLVTIPIYFKFATPRLRVAFADYIEKYDTATNKISNNPDFQSIKDVEINSFNDEQQKIWNNTQKELDKVTFDFQIELFKLIIDTEKNNIQEKGYLQSGSSSNFWQGVNTKEVNQAIISFRQDNQI